MKDLSRKQLFWTLVLLWPPILYAVELLISDIKFTLIDFFSYIAWLVIGVLVGYLLSTKILSRYRHVKGINFIAFPLLLLLVIGILMAIHFTDLRELKPFVNDALISPLIISAITFHSVISRREKS